MKLYDEITFDDMLDILAEAHSCHAPTTKTFGVLERACAAAFVAARRGSGESEWYDTGKFGNIYFPFLQMGNVTSADIFGSVNELIIFAFYYVNRNRYRRIADIGANIGLHSILMSRLGWKVKAYEPDPKHIKYLRRNLMLNTIDNVEIVEAAVSNKAGIVEFVRVLGNTTSSHISGVKEAPYGALEKITVSTENIRDIVPQFDFIKLDVEGHEGALIECFGAADFANMDMIVEVGNQKNASDIFNHLSSVGVNVFSQTKGWQLAKSLADMPFNYKGGSIFISQKPVMPWFGE